MQVAHHGSLLRALPDWPDDAQPQPTSIFGGLRVVWPSEVLWARSCPPPVLAVGASSSSSLPSSSLPLSPSLKLGSSMSSCRPDSNLSAAQPTATYAHVQSQALRQQYWHKRSLAGNRSSVQMNHLSTFGFQKFLALHVRACRVERVGQHPACQRTVQSIPVPANSQLGHFHCGGLDLIRAYYTTNGGLFCFAAPYCSCATTAMDAYGKLREGTRKGARAASWLLSA